MKVKVFAQPLGFFRVWPAPIFALFALHILAVALDMSWGIHILIALGWFVIFCLLGHQQDTITDTSWSVPILLLFSLALEAIARGYLNPGNPLVPTATLGSLTSVPLYIFLGFVNVYRVQEALANARLFSQAILASPLERGRQWLEGLRLQSYTVRFFEQSRSDWHETGDRPVYDIAFILGLVDCVRRDVSRLGWLALWLVIAYLAYRVSTY